MFSFLEIKFQNGLFSTYVSHLTHQEKDTNIDSAHIQLTYTYFAHPIDLFAFPILQKNDEFPKCNSKFIA